MGCDLVAGGHPPNPLTLREGGKIGSYARNDRAGWHPSLPLWIPAFAGMTFTRCDDGFSLAWRFLVGMTFTRCDDGFSLAWRFLVGMTVSRWDGGFLLG